MTNKNGVVTLKTHQGEIWKRNSHRSFWICVWGKLTQRKSSDYWEVIVFEKLRFQNVFCPHQNAKPAFPNSSGLMSVLEKLRFLHGLVWTVGLKLRFQLISPSLSGRGSMAPLFTLNWNIVGITKRILTPKKREGKKFQRRTSHLLRVPNLIFTLSQIYYSLRWLESFLISD